MASKEEQILDLKRRAISLRESGDTNEAMALLAQARDLEFENASIDDFREPIKLKQLAVVLKKKGDLEGARNALVKAKQIEKEGAVPQQQQHQTLQHNEPEPEPTQTTPTEEPSQNDPTSTSSKEKCREAGSEKLLQHAEVFDAPGTEYNNYEDHDDDDGGEELTELMQLGENNDDSNLLTDVSFSVQEMADQEMMTEFKLGGMPVPTDEEYQAKILECKKSALAFKKAGDTTHALQELQNSKQLEKVRLALSQMGDGLGTQMNEDADAWMNTLNDEESELLGELFSTKNPSISENQSTGGNSIPMENIFEELQGFMEDPGLLMDAIAMGMEVPSVEEVRAKAEEKKQLAVEHKKAGNLEGAKASLLLFKQLTALASKLELILEQMERKNRNGSSNNDGSNVKIEDLEALVEADETKKVKQASKDVTQDVVKQEAKPAAKSSEELKQEAIRLRDQKKIKEAGEVLKLYKDALNREQQEAELQRRQEIVNELRKEIEYGGRQIRMFEFYERFVDADAQQISAWKEYTTRCSNVSKVVLAKGSGSIEISRKQGILMCAKQSDQEEKDFNEIVMGLLETGSTVDPPDDRLEIAIMDLQKVQENTNLQKLLKKQKREHLPEHPSTIQVDVHVQLPPNEHDTEKSIELVYRPSEDHLKSEEDSQLPSTYEIGKSQYIDLPRDNSHYGKIIRRRIERNKKIQISVQWVPVAPKKGGWFWSKNKSDEVLPPPTLLGKVVIELQGLLTMKCAAAGEFPLMNGSCTKELGGTIRLVARTGLPWTQPGAAQDDPVDGRQRTELVPYNAMLFSLNEPPAPKEI